MKLVLILGNQLFDPALYPSLGVDADKPFHFFMREDRELASYFKFHKHKIVLFFAAMRAYRDELRAAGHTVTYQEYGQEHAQENTQDEGGYEAALRNFIAQNKVTQLLHFEIEDKFFERRIEALAQSASLEVTVWPSPMFLTSRIDFQVYLGTHRRPFMKTFYEEQRKRLGILVKDGEPTGGQWSFDAENRKALPKNVATPSLPAIAATQLSQEVCALVDKEFASHPGHTANFWLPTTRAGAADWLQDFLRHRLALFGPYEDAIPARSEFVFHSVLTPLLNCGLLTPAQVVEEALAYARRHEVPLPSLEGFIRQVIGWREFVHGIYQNFSDKQESTNFWNHRRKLSDIWYRGGSGVPPLDEALTRVVRRGYLHHIERLMVVGSLMLLLEVDPKQAHAWFMEMFVDSSDWVMGPNVYGMGIFSDGGIFATKPYICGSNYLRKMGGYPAGDWCDGVDGLYWRFVAKHEAFFRKNPRLSMMANSARKIKPERWEVLNAAATDLRNKLTLEA